MYQENNQPYVPQPSDAIFYSSDNGLLHVLLMKWFLFHQKNWTAHFENANLLEPSQKIALDCIEKFRHLNESVNNLAPYWSFVRCARVALGMQGIMLSI